MKAIKCQLYTFILVLSLYLYSVNQNLVLSMFIQCVCNTYLYVKPAFAKSALFPYEYICISATLQNLPIAFIYNSPAKEHSI